MNIFGWFLIGYFALNAILYVAFVGRSGPRYTAGGAVFALVVYAALIYFVFQAVSA